MEEVLEVYKRPYDQRYPVICMDELSKQLTKETRIPLKPSPGNVGKYDTEYERNGVANIFLYSEPLRGKYYTKITKRRTKEDWAHTIKELVDEKYPNAEKITLVCDNLNTHTGGALYETFTPKEAQRILSKIEFCHTPKHGSWLNVAEIGLSVLSRQCLNKRIGTLEEIKNEVLAWTKHKNENEKPVDWQFTTTDARIKLKKLYPVIQN